MADIYTKESNDKFLKRILSEKFKRIKGSELLKDDYNNFNISVIDIPVRLKNDIIKKFDNLTCKSKEFQKRFQNLSFKEAFIKTYYADCNSPRCCFCGQLLESDIKSTGEQYIIADIEHIFPKSKFPQLALHPKNFAPCCKECNEVIKGDAFFEKSPMENFKTATKELDLDFDKLHPLKLWKNINIKYVNSQLEINIPKIAKEFIDFYHISDRLNILYNKCYSILFNILRHSNIRSPESLERALENMASSNWHEINDGYSLNNSPQIWQEFIEDILYDECNLIALWDEVKAYNSYLIC